MKNKKGFTLIELIVVIAILGILLLFLVPQVVGYIQSAKETKAKQECSQLVKIANIELVDLYASNSLDFSDDTINLLNKSDYMTEVYANSNVADDSIVTLTANGNTGVVIYAEYISSDDIHVYYNGMIYSLEPLVMSEYARILDILTSNDDINSLTGYNRTKALQKAVLGEDGEYVDLTEAEVEYLKNLVDNNDLSIHSGEETTYDDLQWVPVSTPDGSDVIMVATHGMTNGKTGAVKEGRFIYYQGKYFYKAHFKDGVELGGSTWVSDDGSIVVELDNAASGEDISEQLWKIFQNQ